MRNARVGDLFTGYCSICKSNVSGVLITGCPIKTVNNKKQVRLGDLGVGSCGHMTIVITASGNVDCENKRQARIGDTVAGVIAGTIITGSPNEELN